MIVTQYAEKVKLKSLKYQQKLESRNQVTPENEKEVWDHLSQFYGGINICTFATEALKKRKFFNDNSLLVSQMTETNKIVTNFKNALSDEDRDNFEQMLNMMQDFIWNFINHTPENKNLLIKYSDSLWSRKR